MINPRFTVEQGEKLDREVRAHAVLKKELAEIRRIMAENGIKSDDPDDWVKNLGRAIRHFKKHDDEIRRGNASWRDFGMLWHDRAKALNAAVEFYADKDNWEQPGVGRLEDTDLECDAVVMDSQQEDGGVVSFADCGDYARIALKKYAAVKGVERHELEEIPADEIKDGPLP